MARTYAVTDSAIVVARRGGIGSVKVGNQAWVTAMASGGTVTAIRVGDLPQSESGPGGLPAPVGRGFVPTLGGGAAGPPPSGLTSG